MSEPKVYFVGAGPGDPELITVKGRRLLESAAAVLYTGSLVPPQMLGWVPDDAVVASSEDMSYDEIFAFLERYAPSGRCVRLHTGDPGLYSTIAPQIEFLRSRSIAFEVVPGVTSAFSAAASLGIEYTIPGVSQSVVLTRFPGKTPNPESMAHIFALKHSSLVFYLSALLAEPLVKTALAAGWPTSTPVAVVEKSSWPEQRMIHGELGGLVGMLKWAGIRGTALILLGEFLNQRSSEASYLYSSHYAAQAPASTHSEPPSLRESSAPASDQPGRTPGPAQ